MFKTIHSFFLQKHLSEEMRYQSGECVQTPPATSAPPSSQPPAKKQKTNRVASSATTAKGAKTNGAHAAARLNGHVENGTTEHSCSPDASATAGPNDHMDGPPRSSLSRSRSPAANGSQGFSREFNGRFSRKGWRPVTRTRLPNGKFGRKNASGSPASRGDSANSSSSSVEPPSPSADGFAVSQFPAVRRRSDQSRSSSRQPSPSSSSHPPQDYDFDGEEDEKPTAEYLLALMKNTANQQKGIAYKLNNPDEDPRFFDVETGKDLRFEKRMAMVREASLIDEMASRMREPIASQCRPPMSYRPMTYGEMLERETQAMSDFDDEIQGTTPPALQVENVEAHYFHGH